MSQTRWCRYKHRPGLKRALNDPLEPSWCHTVALRWIKKKVKLYVHEGKNIHFQMTAAFTLHMDRSTVVYKHRPPYTSLPPFSSRPCLVKCPGGWPFRTPARRCTKPLPTSCWCSASARHSGSTTRLKKDAPLHTHTLLHAQTCVELGRRLLQHQASIHQQGRRSIPPNTPSTTSPNIFEVAWTTIHYHLYTLLQARQA